LGPPRTSHRQNPKVTAARPPVRRDRDVRFVR
jgi:hypothetical protein